MINLIVFGRRKEIKLFAIELLIGAGGTKTDTQGKVWLDPPIWEPSHATWGEVNWQACWNHLKQLKSINLSQNFGPSKELRISAISVYVFLLLNDPCLYLCILTARTSLNKSSSSFSIHSNGNLFTNNKKSRAGMHQWYMSGHFLYCLKFKDQNHFKFPKEKKQHHQ